jgi:hypothetical protein
VTIEDIESRFKVDKLDHRLFWLLTSASMCYTAYEIIDIPLQLYFSDAHIDAITGLPIIVVLYLSILAFVVAFLVSFIRKEIGYRIAFLACISGWIYYLPSACLAFTVAQFMIFLPKGLLMLLAPMLLLFLTTQKTFRVMRGLKSASAHV